MKKDFSWSLAASRRRLLPAFVWMYRLEKALTENDWRRARKALGQLRGRGFEVKVINADNCKMFQQGDGI